jgi:RHS repeat-associated protein
VINRSYTIGDSINITGIADSLTSARSEAYTYTASNRLQEGDGIWGTLVWTYDGVGNRASEALTSGSTTTNTYNYPSTSNLLSSLTQSSTTVRSFSYDGAGNVTADTRGSTTYNYAYNKRNRLAELTIGSTVTADYTYDGLERLAIRTTSNMTPAGTTQYVYDRAGHLIAEADSSGNALTEYVWLDDMPLAVVANVDTSPTLYFVHADHLNRPIRMTDGSESVVWDAVYNPFGDVNTITGSASNNLRFPGQYFLIEDSLHYNWYRHYDPTLGRYIQADPLGFVDGPSLYAYVRSNSIAAVDPFGLFAFGINLEVTVIIPTSGGGGIYGLNWEYTSDTGWQWYKYFTPQNCQSVGLVVGAGAQVNFATGDGTWAGPFDNIVGNYGPYTGGYFSSPPGTGNWRGFSGGIGGGLPLGGGAARTNYVPW